MALALWRLNGRVRELSNQVAAQHTAAVAVKQPGEATATRTILSGKKGFNITVPNGWGPLTKAQNSDLLILPGRIQPTVTTDQKAKITEGGYGSDAPSLFIVLLSDAGMGDIPRGVSSEFTIGKGDDMLVGKKYSYTYPADEQVGIGYMRYQNDREYRYSFTTKHGKHLDVLYNVYGSDPRNLVDSVDEIVHSIVVQ